MVLAPIKKDYLVEKRNVLNEMMAKGWTLQELRFFSIYLSKINARDPSTRVVRFSLYDFQRLMGLQRLQLKDIKPTIDSLLSKIVYVPLVKDGKTRGVTAFQLFKECSLSQAGDGVWYVEIDAHDKALPLMFNYKREYFTYPVSNVLQLRGTNQYRMYEILKQYEKLGSLTITYRELRDEIGIEENEYVDKETGKHRWNNFKAKVLDESQKALAQTTNIKYTYTAEKRGGLNKKITFTIEKNTDYTEQTAVEEFFWEGGFSPGADVIIGEVVSVKSAAATPGIDFDMLSGALEDEFSLAEVEMLYRIALPYIEYTFPREALNGVTLKMFDYFQLKYAQLKAYRKTVRSRFGLLRTFIEADAKGAAGYDVRDTANW